MPSDNYNRFEITISSPDALADLRLHTDHTPPGDGVDYSNIGQLMALAVDSSRLDIQPYTSGEYADYTHRDCADASIQPIYGPVTPRDILPYSETAGGQQSRDSPSSTGSDSWLTPLHVAVKAGHNSVVCVMLKHIGDCNERDSEGRTPLAHAIMGKHQDITRSLLRHGAQIRDVDGQQTSALHLAAELRRESILEILLNYCGDADMLVDIYNNSGQTPLHVAIEAGFEEGVRLLLQRGANLPYMARNSVTTSTEIRTAGRDPENS